MLANLPLPHFNIHFFFFHQVIPEHLLCVGAVLAQISCQCCSNFLCAACT